MKNFLIAILVLFANSLILGQNNSKDIPKSPLTIADVESVFGKGFKEEAPGKFGDIISYRFTHKDYTVQVTI